MVREFHLNQASNVDCYYNRLDFLQSDWLTAGPYNTAGNTFLDFCRKLFIFQVSVVLALERLKIQYNVYPVFQTFQYQTKDL